MYHAEIKQKKVFLHYDKMHNYQIYKKILHLCIHVIVAPEILKNIHMYFLIN